MIVTGKDGSSPWGWIELHEFVYHPATVRTILSTSFQMEKVSISRPSISVCRLWVRAARHPEWNRCYILSHHVYFIPSKLQVKDAIALACRVSSATSVATKVHWEAAKVMELDGRVGKDEENEDGGCYRDGKLPHLFWDPKRVSSRDLVSFVCFSAMLVK